MNYIKTILAALSGALAAAVSAVESVGAGVVKLASLTERVGAPRFKYDFECWGPKEHERDEYNRVRAEMERAEKAGDTSGWLKLRDLLSGFELEKKWADGFSNLVTTAGKNDLLTQYLKGSAYTAAWFVGLIDNAGFTAINAADTAASHAGWSESSAYSNGTRPALTLGTASAGSIDNSASKASYTINATATINGAFTITNSTKGGTTGTLYSAGSFGTPRSVISGDTLQVQVTLSA